MKIGLNYNFIKFDTAARKQYNNPECSFKRVPEDTFSRNNESKMNYSEEIEKLLHSKKITESPVRFLPEMLRIYFNGGFSQQEFSSFYISAMNKRKFYLSILPQDKIDEKKALYMKEMVLADNINKLALKTDEYKKDEFDSRIIEAVKNYNADYQEGA